MNQLRWILRDLNQRRSAYKSDVCINGEIVCFHLRGIVGVVYKRWGLVFYSAPSKELSTPADIQLERLSPYSPELNPVEHLWDYIREQKGFNNHNFPFMDELEDHLEHVLKNLHQEKDYIPSLCTFNWMINPP